MTVAEAARLARSSQPPSEPLPPPEYVPEVHYADTVQGLRSPWRAVGLSLLLPGAGQLYGGADNRAKLFMGAEAVVWAMVVGFDRWSAWKDQDAVDHAVEHAQLDPSGKDDQFLEYLEFYDNREQFNREGRIVDPSRPFMAEVPENYWQWDSFESRREYRDLRNAADAAARNATIMIYMAGVNRLISAADAFRLVKKQNSQAREAGGLKISFKPRLSLHNPGLTVNARYRF
jgi:hypothetical protein